MNYQIPEKIAKIIKSKKSNGEKLILIAKEVSSDDKSSHEFSHFQRVYFLSKQIAKESKIAIDPENLLAVCFFHDLGYCLEIKDKKLFIKNQKPEKHVDLGMAFAENILPELGYSKKQVGEVKKAIESHDNFKGSKNYIPTKEKLNLVIQDADRLDAIGAIGLTRWFRYAKFHKMPVYDSKINFSKIQYGQRQNFSVIHNLKSCAVNFYKDLNLASSRKIAKGKEKLIDLFIQEYLKEFNIRETLPASYFGAMKLAEFFQQARNERELAALIGKTIKKSQKTSRLVLSYFHLLKKELYAIK